MGEPSPSVGPPLPVLAVGGIAVVEGQLLLVRRAHPPGMGRWSLPGGRVEPGESVIAAVERELQEETALDVRCGALVGWAERRAEGYHYVILDFAVTPVGHRVAVAGGDASEVAWAPLTEVAALDLVEGLEGFLVDHHVLP